jgi:thiol-disulfide isomerase/thioredoxin
MPQPIEAKAVLFLLAVLLAVQPLSAQAADGGVCNVQGRAANLNFTLKDIAGNDILLSTYKGRVILLDFWATWCAPCKAEIPWLVEFYRKYRQRGLVVLGVSVDDPVSRIKPFAAALKMNYPVLVGAGRDDLQDAFGPLIGFPTSFLISRDGAICVQHTGAADAEELERQIKALL